VFPVTGDFDGDGHLDLVTGNGIFLNESGTGLFDGLRIDLEMSHRSGSRLEGRRNVVVGDFNNDDRLDLVDSEKGIFLNKGLPVLFENKPIPRSSVLRDDCLNDATFPNQSAIRQTGQCRIR
jgi:hypothetical protein